MFKNLSIGLILVFLVLSISSSFAQIEDDAILWTLNLGYAPLKNAETGNSIDGWTANTTVEKVISNSGVSVGMNLAYFGSEDLAVVSPDLQSLQDFSSTSIFASAKYFFNRASNVVPYVGLGLGVHFSKVDYAISGFYRVQGENVLLGTSSLSSFAVAVPFGINYFASSSTYIGLNVTPLWLDKTFYDSDINWLLNFSLGFQFN